MTNDKVTDTTLRELLASRRKNPDDSEGNMETVSENQQTNEKPKMKRGRGRPRVYDDHPQVRTDEFIRSMKTLSQEELEKKARKWKATRSYFMLAKTIRGRQNVANAISVSPIFAHFAESKKFDWLFGLNGAKKPQLTILYELGRYWKALQKQESDPKFAMKKLLLLAVRICELKPTARRARVILRGLRKKPEPATAEELMQELKRQIHLYKLRHPDLTISQIFHAIALTNLFYQERETASSNKSSSQHSAEIEK